MNKIYIAEFRPRDKKIPLFWKLALHIIGTGYYHTGILINNRYFEMYINGYRELPFESFKQLNDTRGLESKSNNNDGDSIDFVDINYDISNDQIIKILFWWNDKIKTNQKFGFTRFIELAFSKFFRKISEIYYNKTGKVLFFAKTDAEKSIRVCSSAVDESLKYIDIDLYKKYDETITVPGLSTKYFPIVYKE